jgi:hypothetical protein
VFVTAELAQGRLRATAASYPPASAHQRTPGPGARAEASRRFDGELGAFLPPIALAATRVEHAAAPADIVALACGDVAGRDETELVTVSRHKVQVGKVGDGRFSVRAEAAWSALSPVAPSPLREPIAGVALVRGERVVAGLSDRADGIALSPALAPLGRLDAPLPWEGVGCLSRSGVALGSPSPCTRGEPHSIDGVNADGIDAFASGTFVDEKGKVSHVAAWRTADTRAVTLRDAAGRTASVPSAGGALALADVDLDGQPELLASVDTEKAEEDAVVVSTWARDGTIAERLRIPVKDGVHALAVCPLEDFRMAPIVAAAGGGLWLVR